MPSQLVNEPVSRPPTYQEVLQRDPRGVPEALRPHSRDMGTDPIKASRYTSAEFFAQEVEKVWLRTWQYACREEDLPDTGDTYVFDLVGKTAIVVRQDDGSLKAMMNVCPHRGRKIVGSSGCQQRLRCPYHGLTWGLDGALRENPFAWDFPHVRPGDLDLPEIRVESWAGFVFVNFDTKATPLLEQLAPMPAHFGRWKVANWYRAAHVGKIAQANWKACSEAFLEAYHIIATHPQFNTINAYDSGQYDVLSDHVTRHAGPSAMPPMTYGKTLSEDQIIEIMAKSGGRGGRNAPMEVEPGMTAREYAGETTRRRMAEQTGYDFAEACDAELIDGISYDFFPNFHLWGGYNGRICYRFRPNGLKHEETLIEVMIFLLAPKDQPKPEFAPYRVLGPDERWEDAPELGYLAGVYDQDHSNFAPVQEGLRAKGDGDLTFAKYLDTRCRHLHHMIDVYMQRPDRH